MINQSDINKQKYLLRCGMALMLFTGYMALSQAGGSTDPSSEKLMVQLNKSVYVAGENMNYRVFAFDPALPQRPFISKVLYFALQNHLGKSVVRWRIDVDRNSLSGSYLLPADLPPGLYQLAVYTNHMRNLPSGSVYRQNLLITSLSKDISDTLHIPDKSISDNLPVFNRSFTQSNPFAIQAIPGRPVYSQGDSVTLRLSAGEMQPGDTVDLSVSVYRDFTLAGLNGNDPAFQQIRKSAETNKNTTEGSTECRYPYENREYILSGQILDKDSRTPVSAVKVILSVVDTISPQIRFTETDSSGHFRFYLNKWYDNHEILLQTNTWEKEEQYRWLLDNKDLDPLPTAQHTYLISGEEKDEIRNLLDSRLIEAVYHPEEVSQNIKTAIHPDGWFSSASLIVLPAEYTELVNFKDIAENILPGTRFNIRNKKYGLQIYNEATTRWLDNNMVLLNGVPFTDLNYLATLGSKDISRIEVIKSEFYMGNMVMPGVVSVFTYGGEIPETFINNNCIQVPNPVNTRVWKPVAGGPGINSNRTGNIPDFRDNLYWLPDLKLTSGNGLRLHFKTSQLAGHYRVEVNGLSNRGVVFHTAATFDVQ